MTDKKTERTIAVALEYDPENPKVPTVAASGYGYIAEKILDLAFAAGVKVRRDADLAEILAALDLDSEIPPEAFAAVAEILSYVYQLNVSLQEGLLIDDANAAYPE